MRTGKRDASGAWHGWFGKYPRAYGEETAYKDDSGNNAEIPPCVRGRVDLLLLLGHAQGNTPVRTGKRRSPSPPPRTSRKYPRAYGEESSAEAAMPESTEIPPCVRGRGGVAVSEDPCDGNTPVRTGKSPRSSCAGARDRKYPRAYGEECHWKPVALPPREIPPCVRGRAADPVVTGRLAGNTPVRTGKSGPWCTERCSYRKYPRAYGEEITVRNRSRGNSEIPPCVRGRVPPGRLGDHELGNTPVRTGKSPTAAWPVLGWGKYPRAYGEE